MVYTFRLWQEAQRNGYITKELLRETKAELDEWINEID